MILTEIAKQYFEGRVAGYKKGTLDPNEWICDRFELNALSAGELIKLIEQAILASGSEHKVIPPTVVIEKYWKKSLQNSVKQYIESWINKYLKVEELQKTVMQEFTGY